MKKTNPAAPTSSPFSSTQKKKSRSDIPDAKMITKDFASLSSDGQEGGTESPIQMKKSTAPIGSVAGSSPIRRYLPDGVRQKMESSFDTDFSQVKLLDHSPLANRLKARALTRGNELHFAPGQYQPNSNAGQQLLGHELAHIVQQRQGRVRQTQVLGKGLALNDSPALESEADRWGAKAALGEKVFPNGPGQMMAGSPEIIQRQGDPLHALEYPVGDLQQDGQVSILVDGDGDRDHKELKVILTQEEKEGGENLLLEVQVTNKPEINQKFKIAIGFGESLENFNIGHQIPAKGDQPYELSFSMPDHSSSILHIINYLYIKYTGRIQEKEQDFYQYEISLGSIVEDISEVDDPSAPKKGEVGYTEQKPTIRESSILKVPVELIERYSSFTSPYQGYKDKSLIEKEALGYEIFAERYKETPSIAIPFFIPLNSNTIDFFQVILTQEGTNDRKALIRVAMGDATRSLAFINQEQVIDLPVPFNELDPYVVAELSDYNYLAINLSQKLGSVDKPVAHLYVYHTLDHLDPVDFYKPKSEEETTDDSEQEAETTKHDLIQNRFSGLAIGTKKNGTYTHYEFTVREGTVQVQKSFNLNEKTFLVATEADVTRKFQDEELDTPIEEELRKIQNELLLLISQGFKDGVIGENIYNGFVDLSLQYFSAYPLIRSLEKGEDVEMKDELGKYLNQYDTYKHIQNKLQILGDHSFDFMKLYMKEVGHTFIINESSYDFSSQVKQFLSQYRSEFFEGDDTDNLNLKEKFIDLYYKNEVITEENQYDFMNPESPYYFNIHEEAEKTRDQEKRIRVYVNKPNTMPILKIGGDLFVNNKYSRNFFLDIGNAIKNKDWILVKRIFGDLLQAMGNYIMDAYRSQSKDPESPLLKFLSQHEVDQKKEYLSYTLGLGDRIAAYQRDHDLTENDMDKDPERRMHKIVAYFYPQQGNLWQDHTLVSVKVPMYYYKSKDKKKWYVVSFINPFPYHKSEEIGSDNKDAPSKKLFEKFDHQKHLPKGILWVRYKDTIPGSENIISHYVEMTEAWSTSDWVMAISGWIAAVGVAAFLVVATGGTAVAGLGGFANAMFSSSMVAGVGGVLLKWHEESEDGSAKYMSHTLDYLTLASAAITVLRIGHSFQAARLSAATGGIASGARWYYLILNAADLVTDFSTILYMTPQWKAQFEQIMNGPGDFLDKISSLSSLFILAFAQAGMVLMTLPVRIKQTINAARHKVIDIEDPLAIAAFKQYRKRKKGIASNAIKDAKADPKNPMVPFTKHKIPDLDPLKQYPQLKGKKLKGIYISKDELFKGFEKFAVHEFADANKMYKALQMIESNPEQSIALMMRFKPEDVIKEMALHPSYNIGEIISDLQGKVKLGVLKYRPGTPYEDNTEYQKLIQDIQNQDALFQRLYRLPGEISTAKGDLGKANLKVRESIESMLNNYQTTQKNKKLQKELTEKIDKKDKALKKKAAEHKEYLRLKNKAEGDMKESIQLMENMIREGKASKTRIKKEGANIEKIEKEILPTLKDSKSKMEAAAGKLYEIQRAIDSTRKKLPAKTLDELEKIEKEALSRLKKADESADVAISKFNEKYSEALYYHIYETYPRIGKEIAEHLVPLHGKKLAKLNEVNNELKLVNNSIEKADDALSRGQYEVGGIDTEIALKVFNNSKEKLIVEQQQLSLEIQTLEIRIEKSRTQRATLKEQIDAVRDLFNLANTAKSQAKDELALYLEAAKTNFDAKQLTNELLEYNSMKTTVTGDMPTFHGKNASEIYKEIEGRYTKITSDITDAKDQLQKARDNVKLYKQDVEYFKVLENDFKKASGKYEGIMKDYLDLQKAAGREIKDINEILKDLRQQLREAENKYKKAVSEEQGIVNQMNTSIKLRDELKEKVEKLETELSNLKTRQTGNEDVFKANTERFEKSTNQAKSKVLPPNASRLLKIGFVLRELSRAIFKGIITGIYTFPKSAWEKSLKTPLRGAIAYIKTLHLIRAYLMMPYWRRDEYTRLANQLKSMEESVYATVADEFSDEEAAAIRHLTKGIDSHYVAAKIIEDYALTTTGEERAAWEDILLYLQAIRVHTLDQDYPNISGSD